MIKKVILILSVTIPHLKFEKQLANQLHSSISKQLGRNTQHQQIKRDNVIWPNKDAQHVVSNC